jgi:hypothetical protein
MLTCVAEVGWASEGRNGSFRRSSTAVKGLKGCLEDNLPAALESEDDCGCGIGTWRPRQADQSTTIPAHHETSPLAII